MHTTAHITPPSAPTLSDELTEIAPLAGAVAGYGPPVLLVAGGWVLLALMLAGPFALLVTLVAVMLVAATVVAGIVALPYLLVRQVRSLLARHHEAAQHRSLHRPRAMELRQA